MPAVLFGSISSVADTSELQRAAFNDAFRAHNLDWRWDRPSYQALLARSGGAKRIADYAASIGEHVDAEAVHATKSKMFRQSISDAALGLREGVLETLTEAKKAGWRTGLVTTTSPGNVAALLERLSPELDRAIFDVVVDSSYVEASKPDPAAYLYALDKLDESAAQCVAVEDNVEGIQSAIAAGVTAVAFPNANTADHDFGVARTVRIVSFADLVGSKRDFA